MFHDDNVVELDGHHFFVVVVHVVFGRVETRVHEQRGNFFVHRVLFLRVLIETSWNNRR